MSNSILLEEFNLIKQDLIVLYDKKGMRTTGKWAESLRVESSEYSASLFGENYSQQLETGRKLGRFPPIKQIEQWILDKGVFSNALKKIKLSSLAFLIARKIAKNGWNRKDTGGVNLISEIVTPQRIQEIIDRFGVLVAFNLTTEIVGFLNEFETV